MNKKKMIFLIILLIFLLVGILLLSIFFTEWTSLKSPNTLSNPESIPSLTNEIPASATSETPLSSGLNTEKNGNLKIGESSPSVQNPTESVQYENKTLFELSLADMMLVKNETIGTNFSYILKINVTVKNSGTSPVDVVFLVSEIVDNAGDGCEYDYGPRGWCAPFVELWVEPGESETKTSKVFISSTKEYDDLSSQTFQLYSHIEYSGNYSHGHRYNEWLIDLKNSTISKVL